MPRAECLVSDFQDIANIGDIGRGEGADFDDANPFVAVSEILQVQNANGFYGLGGEAVETSWKTAVAKPSSMSLT